MSYAVFDCETTTSHNGNPFDPRNRLCVVGILNSSYTDHRIEYSNEPYGEAINDAICRMSGVDLLVGFNIKFDIHWIKNYSDEFQPANIWDCQLAAYILSGQTQTWPSLNECCNAAGLGSKLDVVKLEYWDRGYDTTDVPWDILTEYLKQDVVLTERLYLWQREKFKEVPRLYRLFQLGCADLLCLLDAERNGLRYNISESHRLAKEVNDQIEELDIKLKTLWPFDFINWGSHDHLSIILFGGEIYTDGTETYERTLKSGKVRSYERKCYVPIHFPRLVEPDKRSESARTAKFSNELLEGINTDRRLARKKPLVRTWSTEESLLRSYQCSGLAKETIELLLKRSELVKLVSTYYQGIPELIEEMKWPESMIHGSFNQVSTRTSRLSSNSPNLQNFAGLIKPLFYSRYQ